MAGVNKTSLDFTILPNNSSATAPMAQMVGWYIWRAAPYVSANAPVRFQIQWLNSGMTEDQEPSAANWNASTNKGDLVNVSFYVYATTDMSPGPSMPSSFNPTASGAAPPTKYKLLGILKKSRDIANTNNIDGTSAVGHRFTVDISKLLADELSYSLVPIGKGTFQNYRYGGMNGGLTMQDNVALTAADNKWNISKNGMWRHVKVVPVLEVINGDGELENAGVVANKSCWAFNTVNQIGEDSTKFEFNYSINGWNVDNPPSPVSQGAYYKRAFLSRCPNGGGWTDGGDYPNNAPEVDDAPIPLPTYSKPVRIDEEAEWLYWFQATIRFENKSAAADWIVYYRMIGYTDDGTWFYIDEFNSNFDKSSSPSRFRSEQHRIAVQNVSPSYINSHARNPVSGALISPIISATNSYFVYLNVFDPTGTNLIISEARNYTIDREDENNAFGFVRFHWLNSVGGIDSYTAKRNVTEGFTISRDIIERRGGDIVWKQDDERGAWGAAIADDTYYSDTMRGGDIYKGGKEVKNVNVEQTQSVYTEPLNKTVANWLREMITSPNVWIEKDTEGTDMNNRWNPYLRPSTKDYVPVIITNSDIETVNQEQGLVTFNIDYVLGHKFITQRN